MKQAETKDRIKEALSIREMKQSELVEKTGIDKGQMSSYLAGRYKPKQTNLNLIAKALSVNEAWLIGYDVPMERIDSEDSTILKRDAILEDIENILNTAGYTFSCESYDDDFFVIKHPFGQTIASFYDYELIPKYELLKRNGKLTAELLISDSSKLCPAEWKHIEKYRSLDLHGQQTVDIILDRELKRSGQLQQSQERITELEAQAAASDNILPMVKDPAPDYLTPNAAHADDYAHAPDNLKQLEEDIMDDENF